MNLEEMEIFIILSPRESTRDHDKLHDLRFDLPSNCPRKYYQNKVNLAQQYQVQYRTFLKWRLSTRTFRDSKRDLMMMMMLLESC